MVKLTPFRVEPKAFHETIVMPQFGDILEGDVLRPSPEEGDWQIIDNASSKVPIMDLFGKGNILKRRDATCKLIYSPVARMAARYIEDEKLYGATEDCQEEFYQGCFEDYEQQNWEVFGQHIMEFLNKGVSEDLYVGKYFGDITRASDPSGYWNWNKFNGIWPAYFRYVQLGLVKTPIAIPEGELTPSEAHDLLAEMYAGQDPILKNMPGRDKAFYTSQSVYDAYGDWLFTAGGATFTITELQAGTAKLYYKGIEIRPKYWDGVLTALNGGVNAAHAAILTVRGNFLYKTDSTYGGGPKRNEAVRYWWSDDDNVWRRQIHMRAGTELAAPQLSVLAITEL